MTTLAVEDPAIPEVLDRQTGIHLPVGKIIGVDYARAIQLRMVVKDKQMQGTPLYACSLCGVPVSLLMHPVSRLFYFKHVLEDGRCPQISSGELSRDEIDARRYNGAKESERHIQMKAFVAASLAADSRFSNIRVEKRWTNALSGEWRQPDVRATYNGIEIVFEIQLSTTYLDVIVERRRFYQKEGGLLFWIFAEFNDDCRRLLQDDVFYNNNQNAFIVSSESTAVSVRANEFRLNCAWTEPESSSGISPLRRTMVSFHELTLDIVKQQAFYFDYEAAKNTLIHANLKAMSKLRDRFETAWISTVDEPDRIGTQWRDFRREFGAIGVSLPTYQNQLHLILINALYSAKYGRVIGWRYSKFIEVAHRIATGHKPYLRIFRIALGVYKRGEQLISEDKSGRWDIRVKAYKAAMKREDPEYAPDETHYDLLRFLFPELFENVK